MEKSFLKWAGGKYRLLSQLIPILNEFISQKTVNQTFIEPFVGSGTVYLNFFGAENYIINDTNQDLINVFHYLKEDPEFINKCIPYFTSISNDKEYFQNMVKKYNNSASNEQKAHMFIYLNKHCFNGLMRFNKKNFFNTPFGKYANVSFPHQNLLLMKNKLLSTNTAILCRDFKLILENSGVGDIVYCDPPYVNLTENISFKQYGKEVFDLKEQKILAELAYEAAKRGAKVIISNHFTSVTEKLYEHCTSYKVWDVKRTISATSSSRKTVQEILAIYDFK